MNAQAMCLAIALLSMGGVVHAEERARTELLEEVPLKLSPNELVFISKLSDAQRRSFTEKLSVEQRRSVMIAFENGALPDEAVHRMVTALEVKVVAQTDGNSDG